MFKTTFMYKTSVWPILLCLFVYKTQAQQITMPDTLLIQSAMFNKPIIVPKQVSILYIKTPYQPLHFGWFCKKELQIEHATKIPLRIRIGSLQYCNYLEEKH